MVQVDSRNSQKNFDEAMKGFNLVKAIVEDLST